MLLFASPAIGMLIKAPSNEGFSELYLLGPNHLLQDIPFNIKKGEIYSVFLGIKNNMAASSYYTCIIKFGDEHIIFPNKTENAPSNLPSLYEYKVMLSNKEQWEAPLNFKINNFTFTGNTSSVSSVNINGLDFFIDKQSNWDSDKKCFIYYLVIELWFFDFQTQKTTFHNRSLQLVLNITG